MTNNMKIWDVVKTTDPQHTKPFKRAGGFSGTAIKPIYSIETMTKHFGPVGMGWGYTKPEYVTHNGCDDQILVYCTVGVWYVLGEEKSSVFYGVGGDFVVVKQSAGLKADDEAYKKAFTDAMGNAFKHLGLSADIHMNQFDGSKYAQEKEKEQVKVPERMQDSQKLAMLKKINEATSEADVTSDYSQAALAADTAGDTEARAEFKKAAIARKAQLKLTIMESE